MEMASNVEVLHIQGIILDELAAGFDLVAFEYCWYLTDILSEGGLKMLQAVSDRRNPFAG